MSTFPEPDSFVESNPFAAPLSSEAVVKHPDSDVEQIRRQYLSHEASIQSMGLLYLLGGSIGLLLSFFGFAGLLSVILSERIRWDGLAFVVALWTFVAVYAGFQLWTGWGLRKLNRAVQTPATVLAAIGLLGFPIGTLISAYFMWLLQSSKGKYVLSEQYREVVRQTPHIKYRTSIIVWIFVGLLLLLVILGITAAILGD